MPNFVTKTSINFVDAKGFYSHMRYFVSADSNANNALLNQAVFAALIPLSNAELNGGMGAGLPPQVPGELGTQADFGSIEDKANLTYIDAVGNIHRWQLPAPVEALFLADGMTVDPTNTDLVAFNAVWLNAAAHAYFVASRGQNAITEFIGGVRIRRPNQRRISIFTRNPEETGPAE